MNLSDMTKDERSLLLFLETCAVDHGGLVDTRHMNSDDFGIAKRWHESGFLRFGRIAYHDIIQVAGRQYAHWCELSDRAWELASQERCARAERMASKRTWKRTEELREAQQENP